MRTQRRHVTCSLAAMRSLSPCVLSVAISCAVLACGASDHVDPPPGGQDDASAVPDAALDDGGVDAPLDAPSAAPEILFPRTGISADELGVVVNDSDPLSVAVASYYVAARKIPAANVVHVAIANTTANAITADEFGALRTKVDGALGAGVQALLLTWTKPFAVESMSITSAFAMGYRAIAAGDTCNDPNSQALAINPYAANRSSTRPFTDLKFRPTMTIPATTLAEAQAVIDRGVASDGTMPKGSAYLMNTSDQTRSARCIVNASFGWTNECQRLLDTWDSAASGVDASIVAADSISNKNDVLFYVQGLASVPNIATNKFLPGAIADHLTSYGGQIPTSGQMSAFEFLKGGATASYGTVVEPCAFQQKFPDPSILIPRYFGGNTLIEAYWKSVLWPAEGIFIGEPLARPFGSGFTSRFANGSLTIETTAMSPNVVYLIEAADSAAGPFSVVLDNLSIPRYRRTAFVIPHADRKTYRFRAR
jgi:uncharacterized protein (TIGR03790 family)